jgi:hypothetical protein
MASTHRRRRYALSYHIALATSPCADFREFVVAIASSQGRELLNHREDATMGRCGHALEVRCSTTGNATAEKLSKQIEARYPDVIVHWARQY